jgi:hypothetical protein
MVHGGCHSYHASALQAGRVAAAAGSGEDGGQVSAHGSSSFSFPDLFLDSIGQPSSPSFSPDDEGERYLRSHTAPKSLGLSNLTLLTLILGETN